MRGIARASDVCQAAALNQLSYDASKLSEATERANAFESLLRDLS